MPKTRFYPTTDKQCQAAFDREDRIRQSNQAYLERCEASQQARQRERNKSMAKKNRREDEDY